MTNFKFSSKIFVLLLLLAILSLGYTYTIKNTSIGKSENKIEILDQETLATVIEIRYNDNTELLKGSILDYEAIYLTYKFEVGSQTFHKTELIKKSEKNISAIYDSYEDLLSSKNKINIRYNSSNPRLSEVDLSKSLAVF